MMQEEENSLLRGSRRRVDGYPVHASMVGCKIIRHEHDADHRVDG